VLLLHHRVRSDYPLVLLANRDETYDRPFEPPAVRDAERGIVAPRDLRAGGTWLGRNRWGLVAAITNRRGQDVRAGARSRGLLVGDALLHETASAARDWVVGHVRSTPYAGFNLLLADGRDALVVRHRSGSDNVDVVPLSPGAHVLTNLHELDELSTPRGGEHVPSEPIAKTVARLERLAGDTSAELPGGHRICKREETRGTVASAVLALGPGQPEILRFANGPPDRMPFADAIPKPAPRRRTS
jgi:hypothetical protein